MDKKTPRLSRLSHNVELIRMQPRGHTQGQGDRGSSSIKQSAAAGSTPFGPLSSGRRDPFASFARRLSPVEDFLLDYCKCEPFTQLRWR
ncbi:hypothetical protein CaCOL14_007466 [Colletotrichum acutatum]